MKGLTRAIHVLDRLVEWIGAYLMVVMVIIVTWQVFSRYVLNASPSWSDETVLMLMTWFGFLSIVIGFRRREHLAISLLVTHLPLRVQWFVEKVVDVLVIGFGVLLLVEGYRFTVMTWKAVMPVTQMPQGLQYIVIPITGLLTIIYGFMWLFGVQEVTKQ
ncbi:TRAP transporter small permease [Alicyclobacillus sp. SO9]|uniref:TRAP transporter small permease n=1 Tax=Alicyclobacillus sp. SO9 TaxID=2665646 RepID=UPI0018E6DD65|nr:TRAP transporter small permease [Alicyclobacillus sp. SO9]QQE77932.1 TRAP transporter small permease [Alicyclobacillus sp. SO9]